MDNKKNNLPLSPDELIADYRLGYRSRQASIIGRREVLTGKAKFGIFGDGKELPQLAIARNFGKGDWRSGYYRDQTWMMALDLLTLEEFFAQLYAHADPAFDPNSGGRNMNGHFSTQLIDADGNWLNQTELYNSSADIAPTAAQMPRAVGLAYASALYRKNADLKKFDNFSKNGNEITWTSIGNASTSEGLFWETVNAIGVLHAPAIISIYDDGYGISVPNEFQMVKENISAILQGFQRVPCPAEQCDRGYDLYQVHAWDYPALLQTYTEAADTARKYHIPALVHVTEATQPQGHSTSGSQERYKSKERLEWEYDNDCLRVFRQYLVDNNVASDEQLTAFEAEDKKTVEQARKMAWESFQSPIKHFVQIASRKVTELAGNAPSQKAEIEAINHRLVSIQDPIFSDAASAIHEALVLTKDHPTDARKALIDLSTSLETERQAYYNKFIFSDSAKSPLKIKPVEAKFSEKSPTLMGFEILNKTFDEILAREPLMVAFGEDVGHLGDVNQAFRGLQEKYGPLRVSDTGIREATILGQAIGLALRGFRPIAEMQ